MMNNPYQKYSNAQAMTAAPGELTLMLYNGAIRFLKQALTAMEQKQIEQTNKYLLKAQDIVSELMATLNMDYPISKNMMALYDFMNHSLIQANLSKESKPVHDVIGLLEDLRDTWSEVLKLNRAQQSQAAVGMTHA